MAERALQQGTCLHFPVKGPGGDGSEKGQSLVWEVFSRWPPRAIILLGDTPSTQKFRYGLIEH